MHSISIGRDEINKIVLNNRFVSRKHAQLLFLNKSQIVLKDLNSSNGTFVNGDKITECYLKPGDIVKCANEFLNWEQYFEETLFKNDNPELLSPHIIEDRSNASNTMFDRNIIPATPKLSINDTMDILIIIAAFFLIFGFFMPWLTLFTSISAWDIVFGQVGKFIDTSFLYMVLIIPISGILIIYGAAFTNKKYILPSVVLFNLPIATLVIMAIVLLEKLSGSGGAFNNSVFESIIKYFGAGFWLTLFGSIGLPFMIQNVSKEVINNKIKFTSKSITALLVMITGLSIIILSFQNQLFTIKETFRVDPGATMGLPDAYNIMGPIYDTRTFVDTKAKHESLYAGFFVILHLVFCFWLH